MDDPTFASLIHKLNALTVNYANRNIKHMEYTVEWDKILGIYNITKQQLFEEVRKRNGRIKK